MEETWKDVLGYEDYYQVSNIGNIRSLDRYVRYPKGGFALKKSKPISITSRGKSGYLCVHLSKNGKSKMHNIHRLVAEAFIPNPNNYPMINHKDENKLNNCVDNLEWCDAKYNSNYGTAREKVLSKQRKPIIAFDGKHKLGTYFPSVADAARYLSSYTGSICACLKGKLKTTCGHKFEYA